MEGPGPGGGRGEGLSPGADAPPERAGRKQTLPTKTGEAGVWGLSADLTAPSDHPDQIRSDQDHLAQMPHSVSSLGSTRWR